MIATVATIVLWILHFANPYPLIQIPDRGHRLFAVPDEPTHDLVLQVFCMAGAKPYGSFMAGVRQTLLSDGYTVLAFGEGIKDAALSFPVADPPNAAKEAQAFLATNGIETSIIRPSPELGDKLVVLQLPFGWDIAYRLPGKDMPRLVWERKY